MTGKLVDGINWAAAFWKTYKIIGAEMIALQEISTTFVFADASRYSTFHDVMVVKSQDNFIIMVCLGVHHFLIFPRSVVNFLILSRRKGKGLWTIRALGLTGGPSFLSAARSEEIGLVFFCRGVQKITVSTVNNKESSERLHI